MTDYRISGYTVAQSPNPPLWLALIGGVISLVTGDGSIVHGVARAAFIVGLAVWAWWELSDGVNGFRRVLGAAGLVVVFISLVSTFN